MKVFLPLANFRTGFPGDTAVKNAPAIVGDTRDTGLIPGLERFPVTGNGSPPQYPPLGNSRDRGAWQAAGSQRVGQDWATERNFRICQRAPESQRTSLGLFVCYICCSCSAAKSCPTLWPVVCQAPLSLTTPWSLLKFVSIELAMVHNHLILCCLQGFPASGSFPVSRFFTSGRQSIGASASASASVLPMNIQGWSPLGLTGWISLQSKGLSKVYSITTIWKHQFFSAQPSLWSNSHIHT